jgi:cyd operon protein YbgT
MHMGLLKFLVYFAIALVILLLCIILGDRAPWYFAWVLGTGMIILIAVSGAVLLEGQEEEQMQREEPH